MADVEAKVEEEEEGSVSCVSADCKLSIHNFSRELLDKVVHFQVLQMSESLYVWIGTSANMTNMCVAMLTKYEDTPAVSCLLGNMADMNSSTLAKKLAKRTKKQVFISYNLPMDNTFVGVIEKSIIEEMKSSPDKF